MTLIPPSARAQAADSLTTTPALSDSAALTPAPTAGDRTGPATAPPNARAGATRKVRLAHSDRNVVRTGPGESYAIAGVYPRGETFTVIAKSGPWYNVRLSDSETGWIHSALCKEFDDMSDLEFRPNPRLYSRTGSFVLGGYGGAYAFDRKSNSLVLGGVWELLPGRQMVPFVSGGGGASMMQGETEVGFNFGGGTALFISKRTAMRWEARDFRIKTGPPDARVTNHNVEFSFGPSYLF